MELDRITTAVRPRSPWEAIDLGLHLARRWWREILIPWLLAVPALAAAVFYLLADWPLAAIMVFWLLKPLYDRIPLFILSRALFGAAPGWRETLAALPGLLGRDLPWTMLHRIDFIRAFNLPVRQLEGLRGRACHQRLQLLQRRARGHATALTFLFMGLEGVVMLSLFWLVPLLLPREINEDLIEQTFFLAIQGDVFPWVLGGLYVVAVVLLEPLYVAAGFSLYLNRRTLLEAWDIELSFRRLARRLAAGALALAVLGIGGAGLPQSALADGPPTRPEVHPQRRPFTPEESKAVIQAVLGAPEFDARREIKEWRYTGGEDRDDAGFDGFDFALGKFFARFAELVLWIGLGVALVLLMLHREKWLRIFRSQPPPAPPAAPQNLFGLDIRPESLPDDVPESARALWRQGRQREAMSLLYRGALAALVHRQGIAFSSGHTENDCLRILRPLVSGDLYAHFRRLTRAWQQAAYAHRPPEEAQALSLCDSWHEHYGGAS
ncbi:MAG TPA: DUF4129 domain-containing protein [Sedimenticola sp.]|nr:DUF4129 domain-containing protein [Sedimenticola sp.]